MDSYLTMMNEIHVLFVDHELPLPAMNTMRLLEACQYRVTHVELAMAAMQMLTNEKSKFDFVLANINSPDVQAFKLLQLAVSMNIPIIMMSVGVDDDDTIMATRVIEFGAFLYIKRPTSFEMMRCLWQHVARDNMSCAMREQNQLMAANYVAPRGIEFRDAAHYSEENPSNVVGGNNLFVMKEKGKLKRNYYKGRGIEEGYDSENNGTSHGKVKRKICTEWTQDLHERFMNAVRELGEGRCFPKEILELMNVPGLTRMQVASHLQKCRNDNWRSPEERKSTLGAPLSSDGEGGSNQRLRRFGSMPRLVRPEDSDNQVYDQASGGGQGSKTHTHCEMRNDGINIETILMANQTSYDHQQYEALVPHQNNAAQGINSSSPRHQSNDEILALQDMGCLIQSTLPQDINNPQSSSTNFHFVPVYTHDQTNSKGTSIESKSQWPTSSETSNFCSDDSEAKTNNY